MSTTVLYMSMSLDGYIAGTNETDHNALGDDGKRLHDWIFAEVDPDQRERHVDRLAGVNGEVLAELRNTGAVVAGRGTFEPAHGWGGDHHDGVPIWVYSRHAPSIDVSQWPLVTYVDDLKTAMTDARTAAGEKPVLVHGAAVAQLALSAGLLDELEIHLVPVLLGQGRRLFDGLDSKHSELERVRILAGEDGVIHMHYRVLR